MDIRITENIAETIYINHPEASYGIFCFNFKGDLFLNSDYGFYGYAWRAYGTDFKKFMSGLNADYIIDNFEMNYRETTGKKIPEFRRKKIKILIEVFIKTLAEAYSSPK